jgi:hypothetical protein
MEKEALCFCRQKFVEEFKWRFNSEPETMTTIEYLDKDEVRVRNKQLEVVWKKYEGARAVCKAIPIHGVDLSNPMSRQEYFLIEVNQLNDEGERCSRTGYHYGFLDFMHMLPDIKKFFPAML